MSDRSSGPHFSTMAIHAGGRSDQQPTTPPFSSPSEQLIDPATVQADGLARLVDGTCGWSPTDLQTALEERIAALESGSAAIACASGPMAWLLVLQTLMQPGDEVVASRTWSDSPFGCRGDAYESFGWRFKWAEVDKPESFVEALSDRTKAIVIESMVDGDGAIVDIEMIARVARRARVPLLVDNTLATPYLVHPFDHGADIVLHWTAAYLGAFPGTSGGFIIDAGTFDWTGDGRYPAITGPNRSGLVISDLVGNFAFALACRLAGARDFGAALSPSAPSQILHAIETLPLRMQRHAENALAVARHLVGRPAVRWVRYAGLDGDPGREVAQRYCGAGAGAVLTFATDANLPFLARLKLISRSAETGTARSAARRAAPRWDQVVDDGEQVIRLAVGLEDKDDILADLDQALAG